MESYLFFDSASTTRCSKESSDLVQKYSVEEYGNPSSTHAFGQKAAKAIRESRLFLADLFSVDPEQVIFTGSGTESNNLAICGSATAVLLKKTPLQVLYSSTEHSSVRRPAESLTEWGASVAALPVDSSGQLIRNKLFEVLSSSETLISLHQVNNITGAIHPVEDLADEIKRKYPHVLFHADAVQSFGKISVPRSTSQVDLVSLSAHKIEGPKGVGALIVLNPKILRSRLRPLIWGGDQEHGYRAGSQSAGLIAGFHHAAQNAIAHQKENLQHVTLLRDRFRAGLMDKNLWDSPIQWNSPSDALPSIMSLSVPGFPVAPLVRLLEERRCLVSVGSACTAKKQEPDPVLRAMGLPIESQLSSIRISFSHLNTLNEVDTLVAALEDSIFQMIRLKATTQSPQLKRALQNYKKRFSP